MNQASWLPSTLADTVDAELGRLGRYPLREIVECWPQAVGKEIARNAWPARLSRDGTLHIATSSSVWAHELSYCERAMLDRLTEQLGAKTLARLRFAVGELPEPGLDPEIESKKSVPRVLPEHERIADFLSAEIEEPALRERIFRAIATCVARDSNQAS